ncbi:hypothetical protein [Thalassospira sp. CH_XMU1448-2]|uniref:hypothetical protein n=1 Tax=Thalassospira sp. CH_XMU1448-2 TaxID=3107773 RepID=UPI00300BA89F
MTHLEIPKSVFEYFNNSTVKTTVDHLLSLKKGALPSNVQWSDLKEFYRANLFAYQTQCEHAAVMVDLWTTIWSPRLELSHSIFLPDAWTIEKTQKEMVQNFDPKSLWDSTWFGKCFTIYSETKILTLGISMTPEYGIQLSLNFEDSHGAPTFLDLSEAWPLAEMEDSTAWTKARLIEIRAESLDLSPLVAAASDALERIQSYR